jgi:hypothetical protein
MEELGADAAAGSQSPVATMGPPDQGVTGSPGSEPLPGVKGWELPGPAPMEIDVPDPLPSGGGGPSNVQCTSSTKSSTKPRQGTWMSTSYITQSSLPPGSYATTSRLTRSPWGLADDVHSTMKSAST